MVNDLVTKAELRDALWGLLKHFYMANGTITSIVSKLDVDRARRAYFKPLGYPECSGCPESCPENEGHGCCDTYPMKTPDSIND